MLDINYFKKRIGITDGDKLLLKLTFVSKADEKDILELLSGYDIENAPLGFNLLLANLLNIHSNIKISEDDMPRIKGVVRYFQYQNTALLAAFNQIVRELNAKNIPVLLIKGISMKYLYPDMPRYMADVDFAVSFKNFKKALNIALRNGFKISVRAKHSVDLYNGVRRLDLHRFIVKTDINTRNTDNKIFERAVAVKAFGVNVLIPKAEDMFFLTLQNAFDNIIYNKPYPMKILWIFDCLRILESVKNKNENINWDIIIHNASQTGLSYATKLMLEVFDSIVPSKIPDGVISKIKTDDNQKAAFEEYVRLHIVMKRSCDIKAAVKTILFSKNNKYADIKRAVELTLEFFYIKFVHHCFFARKFLLVKISERYL
jgi:hypothetical protein